MLSLSSERMLRRIPEDERRGYFYTDEEMWNVITQNGH